MIRPLELSKGTFQHLRTYNIW